MSSISQLRKDIKLILATSLEGYAITITNHNDPTLKGRIGKVVSETPNMLLITTSKGTIKVSKEFGQFKLVTSHGLVCLSGQLLVGTPKKRSKRKLRTW